MQIQRTGPELLSIYNRLKNTAETLDQSQLDGNSQEDYVNVSFFQEKPAEGQWSIHGLRQLSSHPQTFTREEVDGLISRKTEIKKFAIAEAQFAETPDGGRVRHQLEFVDDGRTLRVKESLVNYGDENFLSSEEQSYLIYQKSGKMRTLKPRKLDSPFA